MERPLFVHRPGEPAPKRGSWEEIGPPDCPILYRRTLLANRWFKVLVHRFVPFASDREPHDHPRSFLTFVLRGGYDDVQPCGCVARLGYVATGHPMHASEDGRSVCDGIVVDEVRAPAVRFRQAEYAHITRVGPKGATTLVLMGPVRREWGFWKDGKWFEWRTFERLFGLNWRCPD